MGGIPRTDQAHLVPRLIPVVKEITLAQLIPDFSGKNQKDSIRLHRLCNFYSSDTTYFFIQHLRRIVGSLRILQPYILFEIGNKLRGDKPHLGIQLGSLFPIIFYIFGQFFTQWYQRFAEHQPVFRTPQGENIHPRIHSHLPQRDIQDSTRVGNTGSIHEKKHIMAVCQIGKCFYFLRGIEGAQFGSL